MPTSTSHAAPDACPGALRLHEAADGWLARVRLPGGLISPAALRGLAGLSEEYGDGRLELTSRGNLQVRGLPAESDFAVRLADLGLLPAATHERVRNIVASPLGDLADLVRDLDRELCGTPRLAGLSGRFLFGLDDGSGDILALRPDIAARSTVDGFDVLGLRVPRTAVVPTMLSAAGAFLDERAAQGSTAWRMADLTGGMAGVAARIGGGPQAAAPIPPPEPAGALGPDTVALLAPLGRLTAAQARLIAVANVTITPWRSVVVSGHPDPAALLAAAEAAGLGTGPESRWYGVSACTGRPGCAKALADVQADAAATEKAGDLPVHWSGCERRCGRPRGRHLDILATPSGYITSEVT